MRSAVTLPWGRHDLDRVRVQYVLGALHQVVRVERGTGDVLDGTLVRHRDTDDGLLGTLGKMTHDFAASGVCACSFSRLWPSIAER
ncbi:hypothetical protein RKD30_005343 [Streptomyces pristinaespiralis]